MPDSCEASLGNFLADSRGAVTVVDWENSGWGDPCFDVANIVMPPQLAHCDLDTWHDLFVEHAASLGDHRLAERTRAHARVMAAWWVVRLRQELIAPTSRLPGVDRPTARSREELVELCEERAAAVLGL